MIPTTKSLKHRRPAPGASRGLAFILAAGAALPGLPAPAAIVLSNGHMDIGIAYETGAWNLHVHKEWPLPEEEYPPDEAVFLIGAEARVTGGVPGNPASTAFFGAAGSPLWILPKTENPALPFLGVGAEELDPADWLGNPTLSLVAVRGPGHFFVWDIGSFGDLQSRMNTRDGISVLDRLDVIAGSHGHYFMGFTAEGEYEVDLSVAGLHAADGPTASGPATYRFSVVPEPGATSLLALGGAYLWLTRGNRGARAVRATHFSLLGK